MYFYDTGHNAVLDDGDLRYGKLLILRKYGNNPSRDWLVQTYMSIPAIRVIAARAHASDPKASLIIRATVVAPFSVTPRSLLSVPYCAVVLSL